MALSGKVVIVTGASAGIGKSIALELGKEKATVVIAARRADRLQDIAKQLESNGGVAFPVTTDVSVESQVEKLVQSTLDRFGKIDVLINNAGAGLLATVQETTPEQMEKLWQTNVMSTYYGIRHILAVFRKQGCGQVITISSMTGRRGAALKSAYSATKFAQIGLMESLRMELMGSGIHCTIVYPGATETEFLSAMENPGNRETRYYGSMKQPEEVARAIIKAIYNPRIEVITQKFGRMQMILNAVSPGLADWLVKSTVKKNLKL